jgi:hypothetical protein
MPIAPLLRLHVMLALLALRSVISAASAVDRVFRNE